MRFSKFLVAALVLLFALSSVMATETEEELTRKFLDRAEKKHTTKLTWISGYFSFNRINRDNDYNKFANYESNNFTNSSVSWLGDTESFGLDLGIVFNNKWAWSVGGEYWMEMGQELTGSQYYSPTASFIENPSSTVKVFGITTGVQYYLMNAPEKSGELKSLALRTGISAGLYSVSWDLWSDYSNLNLSTSTSTGTNTTYKDNAPSVSLHLGADYPINFYGLNMGLDMSYLYLNFDKVAWYNGQEDEIVASYDGTPDGRVDLNFSGFRGKIEIKRFFTW